MAGKRKKLGWRGQIILIFGMIAAVVFLPTTMVLLVGMVPTLVACLADRTAERVRGLTVGSMNMAGCAPFIVDLWTSGHTPDRAVEIAFQPLAIIVMYAAAGLGYLIEWAMSGIVATFLNQKAVRRLSDIEAEQQKLVERWGREVTGEIPLDPYGFPLEKPEEQK